MSLGPVGAPRGGSLDCSSIPDDQEFCRLLEAQLQRNLRRCSWWNFLVPLVIVVVLAFVFGVPELIQGWIEEWTVPIEEQRRREVQELTSAFINTGTTMGVRNESVAPYLVLGMGIPLLLGTGWGVFYGRRANLRLTRGISRHGLFACPRCGSDTRTDSASCSVCRDVESGHVPSYWREFVGEDPAFRRAGLPRLGRINLNERFPSSPARALRKRRMALILIAVGVLGIICLIGLPLLLSPNSNSLSGVVGYYVFPMALFLVGTVLMGSSCNRFSDHGFCRECKHERAPEASSGPCQECGKEVSDGSLIFAYRKDAPLEWWLCFVPLAGIVLLMILLNVL